MKKKNIKNGLKKLEKTIKKKCSKLKNQIKSVLKSENHVKVKKLFQIEKKQEFKKDEKTLQKCRKISLFFYLKSSYRLSILPSLNSQN